MPLQDILPCLVPQNPVHVRWAQTGPLPTAGPLESYQPWARTATRNLVSDVWTLAVSLCEGPGRQAGSFGPDSVALVTLNTLSWFQGLKTRGAGPSLTLGAVLSPSLMGSLVHVVSGWEEQTLWRGHLSALLPWRCHCFSGTDTVLDQNSPALMSRNVFISECLLFFHFNFFEMLVIKDGHLHFGSLLAKI